MERDLFTAEHDEFREVVRDFLAKEVEPHLLDWEEAGMVPKSLYRQFGDLGVNGICIPEE